MVQGLDKIKRLHTRVGQFVLQEVVAQMERDAEKLVAEMESIKPLPEIEVGWTWGDAPPGSVSIGQVGNTRFARIAITVFATTAQGSGFSASWFEFGTLERFHKTGKFTGRITAQPFFFPIYRANRSKLRSGMTRAVTRGVKKAAK